MKKQFRQSFFLLALCLLVAGWTAGCGDSDNNNVDQSVSPETQETAAMKNFSTGPELETYLKEQYANGVMQQDALYRDEILWSTGAEAPAPTSNDAAAGGKESGDFTKTNVQEEGVDESDKVKTDGTYLYVAGERKVTVAKAVPGNAMQELNEIEVEGYGITLYLYQDTLVILYTPDGGEGRVYTDGGLIMADTALPYCIPMQSYTSLLFMDVSDPANPGEIKRVKAEGMLVSSRLTGGKLHVIQQFLPNLPPLRIYHDGTMADAQAAVTDNQKTLEPLALDDLIPACTVTSADGVPEKKYLVEPADFYFPEEPEGGSNVTVMTFDMANPTQPFQSIGVVASADVVYASTTSLYVAAMQWPVYGILETAAVDGEKSDTDSDTYEKTTIHKFDLTGSKVHSAGSGSVKGRILNQFSLGEYDGVLRVATTTGQSWWWGGESNSKNHVFCIKETSTGLDVVGSVENLAPGEQIYAARFIGDKGYLVTFVQVDPLFTLDLSDPANPKVIGELKIPGYSDYIHPLGEDYLLTIGKDSKSDTDGDWYQGVQLSIFDISDFANPKRVHNEIIGDRGTHSEASYDHKAFTFWANKDLLAVPIDLHEHQKPPAYFSEHADYVSSGLYLYRVTPESGFEFLGSVSTMLDNERPYYYRAWTRGIFIGDDVYAVTQDFVRTAPVSDLNNMNTLIIETERDDKYPEDYMDPPFPEMIEDEEIMDENDDETTNVSTHQNDSMILDKTILVENSPSDYLDIEEVTINNDTITIIVSYSGGCETHEFQLIAYNYFLESLPVQAEVLLSHNSNNDQCEAAINETLTYDITSLKEEYLKQYPDTDGSVIVLRLRNSSQENDYRSIEYKID